MKTRTRLFLTTMIGTLVLGSSLARADDTEVFFNAEITTQKGAPNVLFILDTGYTMNQNVGNDEDNPTRLWVMKDALLRVLQGLVDNGSKVNVGIMRMGVNGQAGVSAAAKGGFLAQPDAPLTQALVDDWKRVLCLNNKYSPTPVDITDCDAIPDNKGQNPVPIFATPQQTDSGSAASPITEEISEAYRYFSGQSPQWGQNALVGPGYQFPLNVKPGKGCPENVKNCFVREGKAYKGVAERPFVAEGPEDELHARRIAQALERIIRRFPDQWYNFLPA